MTHLVLRCLVPILNLGIVGPSATAAQVLGTMEPPFNHDNGTLPGLMAMHLGLVPKGPYRGWTLAWNIGPLTGQCFSAPLTPWTLFDPDASPRVFVNDVLTHANETGNLGCTGHAWTMDGRLLVVGGNIKHNIGQQGCILGAKHAYLFDPLQPIGNLMWVRQRYPGQTYPSLAIKRWYPAVLVIAELDPLKQPRIIILGGDSDDEAQCSTSLDPVHCRDTYEVFIPPPPGVAQGTFESHTHAIGPTQRLFPGPVGQGAPLDLILGPYPRALLLSNGQTVVFGMPRYSTAISHHLNVQNTPLVPWIPHDDAAVYRAWGFVVALPNTDASWTNSVMTGGGSLLATQNLGRPDVQICKPQLTNNACWPIGKWWTDNPWMNRCPPGSTPMNLGRYAANALPLPDGSLVVIGGTDQNGVATATLEILRGGVWWQGPAMASHHAFHSTAVLLPSGKILIAGGEGRSWDYEIYRPWYMSVPRPVLDVVNGGGETIQYGQSFAVTWATGPNVPAVSRIVLMRASSVTHSLDTDQRYVELAIDDAQEPAPGVIHVKMPANAPGKGTTLTNPNEVSVPPGFYMLFGVSSTGVPSVAQWVQLVL